MWTGAGERIWRPLNNPPRIITSAFADESPSGFGLLQRDRNFDHYLDGVYYDRRPSLWVEPQGDWGKGVDPARRDPDRRRDPRQHRRHVGAGGAGPGRAGLRLPLPPALGGRRALSDAARAAASRPASATAGRPGTAAPKGVRKFMVEFMGDPLTRLSAWQIPQPVLWASRGEFSYIFTEAVPDDVPGHWRAQFDLTVTGADPVEMRCYLRNGDEVLSETWLYQYHPPA